MAGRIKFLVGFSGGTAFTKRMRNYLTGPHFDQALEASSRVIVDRMKQNAPSDSGLLESEIEMFPVSGGKRWFQGVKRGSPAFSRAVATEFGSWNFDVGSPERPKTSWPSKSKAGAEMPWLRSSFLETRPTVRRLMKGAHKTGINRIKRG